MLWVAMVERLAIIVTIAFLVTRLPIFKKLLEEKEQLHGKNQFLFIVLFGLFGIIGTYSGVTINTVDGEFDKWLFSVTEEEAVANSRVIGIVVAGLFGGWKVGVGAGVISGIHRATLGGFTGIACGISSILAGFLAGLIHRFYQKEKVVSTRVAFVVGMLAESMQMVVILLLAKPFDQATALVNTIGLPMIVANGVGTAIFVLVVQRVVEGEDKVRALESQKALRVAHDTVKFMRQGLTSLSATETCIVLKEKIGVDAVAMTDKEVILAHVGLGSSHHVSGGSIQTEATRRAMDLRKTVIVRDGEIHCEHASCPLHTAIISPLVQQGTVVGTLKFYFSSKTEPTLVMKELVEGLASILSTQLALAQIDALEDLAKQAELKALQAQVSPHFLFNALNVIHSLIRVKPTEARAVVLALSTYLRGNLSATQENLSTIKQEIEHVRAYVKIEQVRFVDRLLVTIHVDERANHTLVPTLCLQPLVENAIKHGLKEKKCAGEINLSVVVTEDDDVTITISDNGAGMSTEKIASLGQDPVDSAEGAGIGVWNVVKRVEGLVGGTVRIDSSMDKGTTVTIVVKRLV